MSERCCTERAEQQGEDRADHCFHEYGDSEVCCWCGDLFHPVEDPFGEHGAYKPTSMEAQLGVRRADFARLLKKLA